MPNKLVLKRLLIVTENKAKCFSSVFNDKVNIVYGRNTSGKSTLIQSILYAFGINDVKAKLREIIELNTIFRVDCIIRNIESETKYSFIRDGEFLTVLVNESQVIRFNGIGADQSKEHIKLKEYWHNILDSNLELESNSGIALSPIEALFLPYYVSQDIGWVYLRKSFANLDFFKSFKETFLDYYLGVENFVDRSKKREIEVKLKELKEKIKVLSNIDKQQVGIIHARLADEKRPEILEEYVVEYSDINSDVIKKEKELVLKINELSYWRERQSVLMKVNKSQEMQYDAAGRCMVCNQAILIPISSEYKIQQEINDTQTEIILSKGKLKKIQSEINSLKNTIAESRALIKEKYEVFEGRKENKSVNEWVEEKAYLAMDKKIAEEIGRYTKELNGLTDDLKNYSEEENVRLVRVERSNRFKHLFKSCLSDIGITKEMEDRYYDIYSVSAFPAQGVELHKIITAYYCAFNFIIRECEASQRLPFMLDAIFKEDIEAVNKKLIVKCISKWKPVDSQLIFSISDSPIDAVRASDYNSEYFDNQATMIRIGDGDSERCLLHTPEDDELELINKTMEMLVQN